MRLNITVELLDDDNTGMRIKSVDVGNGKIEGYIERFDNIGVYRRTKLTRKSFDRLIEILESEDSKN